MADESPIAEWELPDGVVITCLTLKGNELVARTARIDWERRVLVPQEASFTPFLKQRFGWTEKPPEQGALP